MASAQKGQPALLIKSISSAGCFSIYSALFSSTSDMMFDAARFGVAVVTQEGFDRINDDHLHYSYSWRYAKLLSSTRCISSGSGASKQSIFFVIGCSKERRQE